MSNSLFYKARIEYMNNLKWLWLNRRLLNEAHLNAVINRVDKNVHGLVDDINMIKYIRRKHDKSYDLICGLESLENKVKDISNRRVLRKSLHEQNMEDKSSRIDRTTIELRVPINQWRYFND